MVGGEQANNEEVKERRKKKKKYAEERRKKLLGEYILPWHVSLLTSGYAMVVHGHPKTHKNTSFWGSSSPQGSHSPYILGDKLDLDM